MQVSWIDPDEIARLAAQLQGPLTRDEPPTWELDTLPDFSNMDLLEPASALSGGADAMNRIADTLAAPAPGHIEAQGVATSADVSMIREKLSAIRARAQSAGLIPPAAKPPEPAPASPAEPAAPTAPAAEVFSPQGETLSVRLQLLMQWVRGVIPCEDLLLVDDHGDLLWGGTERTGLAVSAILAISSALRSRAESAGSAAIIRSQLGENTNLTILPCPTRFGLVTLALFNAAAPDEATASAVRRSLAGCVDGVSPPPAS